MTISGVSASLDYSSAAAPGSRPAVDARQDQSVQVMQEIAVAVIHQAQDQQKAMADGLLQMMKTGRIDLYA